MNEELKQLESGQGGKRRGLEIIAMGLGTFALAWLIPKFAFLALGFYGIYRLVAKQSWAEGGFWLGMALVVFLALPLLYPIFWLLKLAGLGLAAFGLVVMFKSP